MKINLQASALTALLMANSLQEYQAFIPSSVTRSRSLGGHVSVSKPQSLSKTYLINSKIHHPGDRSHASSSTLLRYSAELFSETKYTEAAWAAVGGLTTVADYYQATTLEAPFLLDVLLNPSKHGTGGDDGAAAAKRVVEKTLTAAGVNVKELRSGLETHLSKQVKVTGATGQKTMGRTLQKTLETARDGTSALGVSSTERDSSSVIFDV